MMEKPPTITTAAIAPMVHWIRHEKVILDFDLATLYGVETRTLNQAVKRNLNRFPEDFMFQLSPDETESLRTSRSQTGTSAERSNSSQSVMSSRKHRGLKYLPYAFTEQGVAMLSSVLRSPRAVQVNIAINTTKNTSTSTAHSPESSTKNQPNSNVSAAVSECARHVASSGGSAIAEALSSLFVGDEVTRL